MSGHHEWNESLFGCFDDWSSCCCGFCCLPCLFGTNAEKINDQNCILMCCAYSILSSCYLCWLPHMYERRALREKFGLDEDSTCGDLLATLCCGPCAICQEARELKSREGSVSRYRSSDPPFTSQPQSSTHVYRV